MQSTWTQVHARGIVFRCRRRATRRGRRRASSRKGFAEAIQKHRGADNRLRCNHRAMTNNEPISITITLSPAQVDAVVRAASNSRAPSLTTLITDSLNMPRQQLDGAVDMLALEVDPRDDARQGGYMPSDTDDPRLSRSLLRGRRYLRVFGQRRTGGRSRHESEHGAPLRAHPRRARPARALPEDAQVPPAAHRLVADCDPATGVPPAARNELADIRAIARANAGRASAFCGDGVTAARYQQSADWILLLAA
jgi:hypothetical protein